MECAARHIGYEVGPVPQLKQKMLGAKLSMHGYMCMNIDTDIHIDMGIDRHNIYICIYTQYMYMPTAPKTAQRFCVFLRCDIGGLGGVITTCVFVVFDLLRWTHFMLRWTRLLYFGGHTSCYVGDVFCTSVHTLHVTLDTSTVLR